MAICGYASQRFNRSAPRSASSRNPLKSMSTSKIVRQRGHQGPRQLPVQVEPGAPLGLEGLVALPHRLGALQDPVRTGHVDVPPADRRALPNPVSQKPMAGNAPRLAHGVEEGRSEGRPPE